MLVAAAAMAFASCQKEEKVAPETISATLTMHADVEATKTYLGEDNKVFWGTDEAVTLYVGSGETAKFFDSASTDAYEGEASASFTFAMEGVTEADSYALGGIYPASAAMDDNKNATQYKVILPATQNQVEGNYDPSAYIMVLKPEIVDVLPTEYTASFRRATALNKVTLTNVAEDITSVEITVPAEKYLAGRRYFDLTTGESGEVYESGTQTNVVKVNGDFKSGSFDVWFCSWGVELVEGEALTVKMASANNTYTRTITARAEGIKFVEGDLNTLTINMKEADVEAISTITGDYLIASKTSSGWFLMTPTNGSSYYTATGNVSSSSAVTCADFYDVADVENYVWKVAKYDNGYSIQSVYTNKYVAYNGSSNQAYANAELSDAVKMDIQLNGQDAVIESMNVSGRKLQYNAGSPRFAFYGTAQTSVYLISWTPDTTPRITVEDTEYNVSADDETLEFCYTTKNIDGTPTVSVADGATMTNVEAEADAEAGIVTVIFDANAEEVEKTATLVLSYKGAESVYVTITQAAKAAEGAAYYEKVTSEPADWSGTYLMVCDSKNMVLSGISTGGTKYGIGTAVSIEDSKIEATEELASYQVVLSSGTTSGSYLMKFNNSYLYWSSGNSLATNANDTANTNWILSVSDGNVTIKNCKDNTRIIWWNASSPRFACYTSTQTAIQLYKLTESNTGGEGGGETPDPTPDPETPDETKYYVKVTTSTPGAGTYLYVLDKGFVFTGDVSDNSWGKSEAVTITDNKIEATEAINAYAITLEEGTTSGQYAVKLPNGNYLVTTTQKPTSSSTASYMTYDTTEGLCSVNNSDYYFHGNTSSNSFRWYKLSSNQNAGQLYKLN